jgi:hypothetical protein
MLTSETTPAGRRWVGTGETILGRLMTQRSVVRIRPRTRENAPERSQGAFSCLSSKNGGKSSVTYRECESSTLDGILDQLTNELRGGAVPSGRSMSIDLNVIVGLEYQTRSLRILGSMWPALN